MSEPSASDQTANEQAATEQAASEQAVAPLVDEDSRGAAARRRQTRTMVLVAVLLLLGALAVWWSSRMVWVDYTYENGLLPPVEDTIDGSGWATELTPLALVLLAGIAAMFAVRGWAQRIVGALVAAAGAGVLARSIVALTSAIDPADIVRIDELRAGAVVTASHAHPGAVILAIVGGLLAAAAGFVLIARPRPRQVLPSKYETPAARRDSVTRAMAAMSEDSTDDDMTQRLIWEALDAGTDPTDPDTGDPGDGR
ncbi:MAG: TIGR02234 family membrane protein [Tomitella sp.]|nr:TIGR02234 family membrane protein [Tomitella sp.]